MMNELWFLQNRWNFSPTEPLFSSNSTTKPFQHPTTISRTYIHIIYDPIDGLKPSLDPEINYISYGQQKPSITIRIRLINHQSPSWGYGPAMNPQLTSKWSTIRRIKCPIPVGNDFTSKTHLNHLQINPKMLKNMKGRLGLEIVIIWFRKIENERLRDPNETLISCTPISNDY
jgi:hypothetical protein